MTDINYENQRLMDVVDENDQIIDSKTRIDIHDLGLLHREVHVWLFDENHNIFFQKSGLHRPSAGLLDATIGGHVNKGEDYLDAAIRETKEETGISMPSSDLILLRKFKATFDQSKDNPGGTINNFIRSIYICKNPINETDIKKEPGIPGGGFQKLSREILMDTSRNNTKMFDYFILKEEIPYVLEYFKKNKWSKK